MSFMVCHPGRYGDLLWALPAIRALAEFHAEAPRLILPTDPANTTPMRAIVPLLERQEYIGRVDIDPAWSITQDAPRGPLYPPVKLPGMQALGYTSWPSRPLPYESAMVAGEEIYALACSMPEHFFRPWIEVGGVPVFHNKRLLVHWTDRYFELKLGILKEIERVLPDVDVSWYAQKGSRMCQAGAVAAGFDTLATMMASHRVVLTDCSAAHVLATGVGVRTVLVVEPEEARHHFVFWPGTIVSGPAHDTNWTQQMGTPLGERIRPVLGGDRRPTFDSRHVIDEITKALDITP